MDTPAVQAAVKAALKAKEQKAKDAAEVVAQLEI